MNYKIGDLCSMLVLCVFMLVRIPANGQNITSTIVGQVNDSSGAGAPSVSITTINAGTGFSTKVTTSGTGSYSVPGLQPGTYAVTAEAAGFKTYQQTGIILLSAQTLRIDISLKVGTASQYVEVTGEPLLHTDSSTIDSTAGNRQISSLPTAFQSIVALFAVVPGNQGVGSSNPQISGTTHWGSTSFTVNGVSVNDGNNGGASYTAGNGGLGLVNLPALDSLQEFRVASVNANAEYRDVASVIMVTKQGTNQFHGDLYEYFQNRVLDANTYLRNAAGLPRPQDNLNQFGGGIGGPILKDKVFFFFAPSFLRQITPGSVQLTLPTTAMAKGDFSALLPTQLYNPFTGQPFLNNQIPASMIATQAQALLQYLPAPNVPGSLGLPNGITNYDATIPVLQYVNGYTVRGDYQMRPSDSLYGVYSRSTGEPWQDSLGGPAQWGNGSDYGYRDQSASLTEMHTFNPATLNDFRASWFTHWSSRSGDNTSFDPSSLFSGLTPGANRGLPTMAPGGYSTLFDDHGLGTFTTYDVEFIDNFTKVLGRHTIKAGFDEEGYKDDEGAALGGLGSFSFTGVWTGNKGWPSSPQSVGNAFADYLLGLPVSASNASVGYTPEAYSRDLEGYVQDTWQTTPHLTLDYGIRYLYQTPWNVQDDARSLYDIGNNKIALPQNSASPTLPVLGNSAVFNSFLPYFETTQSIGLPAHYTQVSKKYWAPRFGFAYRPFSNTVVRGGYGIYYDFLISALGAADRADLPFSAITGTATSQLPGAPTSTFLPDLTFQNPFGSAVSNIPLSPTLEYLQPDLKNTMVQQWNLTLERQFKQSWIVRASYVGSLTHRIAWLRFDLNEPVVQIPNESLQQQRPHQPWGTITSVASEGYQSFNQMQLAVEKRISAGLSFQGNYSWTRSLDDVENHSNPSRWSLPSYDYGNSTGISLQNLVFNYVYDLPFGRKRSLLNGDSSVLNAIVGGWRVSGITVYASGTPFSVNFSVPASYVGWLGGRANRIAGTPMYKRGSGHNVVKGVPWFNPSAFGPPLPWTWGNTSRNELWGPGMWNWDMSVAKEIPMATERVHTTLRADMLDAFNHFNLSNPSATVGSTQYGGPPVTSTGLIFSGSGNRIIQIGLKVAF